MRKPLLISIGLHVAILLAALISFDWWRDDQFEIVPVELVQMDDIAEEPVQEDEPEEELELEPEPAEPEPEPQPAAKTPPPPVVAEAPEPAPEPEPVPEPKAKAEVKPVEAPKNVPNIRPREKPKPPSKFDTASIRALLDKREQETPPPETPKVEREEPKPKPTRSLREEEKASITLKNLFNQQISRCWTPPAGAAGAENLVVEIRVRFNRDGSLIGRPDIEDRGRMASDGYFRAAAEAARRAIQRCAPYKLPAEDYDLWAEIKFNFDPSKML